MPEIVSNPLLALVKELGMIDDLQLEEVQDEMSRSGKPREMARLAELLSLLNTYLAPLIACVINNRSSNTPKHRFRIPVLCT